MWKLTVHQNKEVVVRKESFEVEQVVEFEDENVNNLMDVIRCLSECRATNKTWYTLKNEVAERTIIDRGMRE